jgi:hypothetical protein
MLLIIDSNCFAAALSNIPDVEFVPLLNSVRTGKRGIAYGGTTLLQEYKRVATAWGLLLKLDQAGRAKLFPSGAVDQMALHISGLGILVSDDAHIVALALVSGARLLCSRDGRLHTDFTNPAVIRKPRGKVYQNSSHSHLL